MSDEDKLLIDQLSSEYKILQDKIDKIGAFKFTIRGWSVTLVVASIFAVGSSRLASPLLLLLLLVFVLLFYLIERKQNSFQSLFATRAFQIEKEIRRVIRPGSGAGQLRHDVGLSPRIAHDLSDAAQRSAPSGRFLRLKRLGRDPELLFYVAQSAAIIIAVLVLARGRSGIQDPQATAPVTMFQYQKHEEPAPEEVQAPPAAKHGKGQATKTKAR